MSQTVSAAPSHQPPSLRPTPTDTPTIVPTQADYSRRRLPNSTVVIGGERRRYHQVLNELRSPQDDVELIWEREQQRLKEREEIQDKFATLFEPPTPRASPTLLPSSLPPASADTVTPLFDHSQRTTLRCHSSRMFRPSSSSSTSSSDFGSFVEAKEDPLSFALTHEQPGNERSTGGDTTPSAASSGTSLSAKIDEDSFQRLPLPLQSHSNKTLEFFDIFTYDAKQRSSAARSQVLDELLLHEDDPMWFVHGVGDDGVSNRDQDLLHATSMKPITDTSDEPLNSDDTEKRSSSKSFSLDIDHDYFRPSPVPSSHASSRSLSPIRHRMPSRSNSIPPPSIAPPVPCQLTASSPTSDHPDLDLLVGGGHLKTHVASVKEEPDSSNQAHGLGPDRSSSLNSLSSKLMSSLLRSSQSSPPSPSSKLAETQSSLKTTLDHAEDHTLDTRHPLFNNGISRPPRPLASTSTYATSPAFEGHVAQSSVSNQRHPFAPAIVTHSASPFAPTFYNSPSGAPGFKGDRYDWDKGFSDALESEGKGDRFNSADVYDSNGSDGRGSSSVISGSRGVWGSGFGFGFGTVGASKSMSHTPSRPGTALAQANELSTHGRDGGNPPVSQKTGSDRADWRDHDSKYNRHQKHLNSTSPTDTENVGGMGELIERKVGTIELVGRRPSSDSVLTPELASMLHAHLPALSRLPRSWVLVYSLDQHGISLNTLYSRCEAHLSQILAPGDLGVSKGMLLAIKDGGAGEEHRAVFGAWIAEGLKLNKGKGYSGGGESFLWKYVDGILKVFKATRKNNYVALCEPDYLSFGGGDGHYGLYLDDTLFEGSSAYCPTFDNEPLCTNRIQAHPRTVKFECLGLEVWGMV